MMDFGLSKTMSHCVDGFLYLNQPLSCCSKTDVLDSEPHAGDTE